MTEFSLALNEDQLTLQKWVHDFAENSMRPIAEEWDEREEFPFPFVEEAARADANPAAVQAASLAYLQAAESAVADMGNHGRVVLMAEAVLAGAAEDATPELERRIAQKLEPNALENGEQP